MHLTGIREGVSPAESIPGKAEQKVHPGADPAKRLQILKAFEERTIYRTRQRAD